MFVNLVQINHFKSEYARFAKTATNGNILENIWRNDVLLVFLNTKFHVMQKLNDYIDRLSDFKQRQAPRFGIRSIGIFGSVARQEAKESSDIDIVVDIERPNLTIMYDLRQELNKFLDCDVDVVRMRSTLSSALKESIERDVIYV